MRNSHSVTENKYSKTDFLNTKNEYLPANIYFLPANIHFLPGSVDISEKSLSATRNCKNQQVSAEPGSQILNLTFLFFLFVHSFRKLIVNEADKFSFRRL
jgi:hypothetical protein